MQQHDRRCRVVASRQVVEAQPGSANVVRLNARGTRSRVLLQRGIVPATLELGEAQHSIRVSVRLHMLLAID